MNYSRVFEERKNQCFTAQNVGARCATILQLKGISARAAAYPSPTRNYRICETSPRIDLRVMRINARSVGKTTSTGGSPEKNDFTLLLWVLTY